MTQADVEHILTDLRRALGDSIASVTYASAALGALSTEMVGWDGRIQRFDRNVYLGDPAVRINDADDPENEDEDDHTPQSHWRRSEALRNLERGGLVDVLLSQQWIVSFFAQWDEIYRPRLAAAHGCEVNQIQVPLLGDLRLLRNSVVHNKGMVVKGWEQKAQVLSPWFSDGDTISLRGRHYVQFEKQFPWSALMKVRRLRG
ncbi:hypothetical protein ACGFIU_16420 [Rhodococcus oryzae]|uniref:hypothetical protein n=1 Tax=Rhodococcus oryzae TaxID=2571143 RepID=UPI0037151F52